MTLLTLPPELYRDIFFYITSKTDLFSLSLVSRATQADAEFLLYNHIESNQRSFTEHLCNTLISSPRLHHVVRSLSISDSNFEDVVVLSKTQYWERIAQLLRLLHQLEELKILDGIQNDNAWVISSCVGRLKKTHIDFTLNASFMDFLHNQSGLLELTWINSDIRMTHEDIHSIIHSRTLRLPVLEHLSTSSYAFALGIIQNHCPSRVWITGPGPRTFDQWVKYMDDCGQHLEPLVSLRMTFPAHRCTCTTILAALSTHAPNLRSLGFLPHFSEENEEIFTALSEFKQLKSIVTWTVVSSSTCHKLASICPSLRLIACLHYSYLHEYVLLPVNPLGQPKPAHDPDHRLWRDA